MGKYDDVLPEEIEAGDQPLIEDLRRAYRPELQDARALTRIRERLLAGDGWQAQTKQIPSSLTQQWERTDTLDRQSGTVTTSKLKTWRHSLGSVAAVLAISFLVGLLVLTFHLAQRISTGNGSVYPHVRLETLIDMQMFSNSTGWALSTDNRVLRTTTGGGNWQEVTPPALLNLEQRFSLAGPWAFHDVDTAWVAVTVNEQQTPEYHSSTAALIFHTTDGGITWQETVLRLSGQRAGQLIFINAHVGWLFAMPDVTIQGPERDAPFDIWHTSDGGSTWTKILNGSTSSARILQGVIAPSISFGNEHVGLMVGQNNRLYRTIDGGITWQLQPWPAATGNVVNVGEPHFFTAKDALFTTTAMTFGASGFAQTLRIVVYATHTAGLTWEASPPINLVAPLDKRVSVGWTARGSAPKFIDMQHGWVSAATEPATTVTGKPSLVHLITIDGGEHWTQLPVSPSLNTYSTGFDYASSSFISPSVGWLADVDSSGGVVLFKTSDGGYSWVQTHAHFPSFVRASSIPS